MPNSPSPAAAPFLMLLSFACFFHQIQSFRILVAANNMLYSHMAMHVAIADFLAEEGHQVTLLISLFDLDSDFPPRNQTKWTKSQNVLLYWPRGEALKNVQKMKNNSPFSQRDMWTEEFELFTEDTLRSFRDSFGSVCKQMLVDAELYSTLEGQQFDLAISEWFDGCNFAFFHHLNIPASIVSTAVPMNFQMAKIFGIPTPLYIPDVNESPVSGTEMGIWERAKTFYRRIGTTPVEAYLNHDKYVEEALGEQFVPNNGLLQRASFMFVNTNEFLDMARPISGKVKHIGGFTLGQNSPAPLDVRMEALLSSAERGAVLVSFGSVADPQQMPEEMFRAFLDTFAAFPGHKFIWKFNEEEEKEGKTVKGRLEMPSNVHKFSWLKQRAILAHPNTRLFISHCGLNSLNEAAFEGVPLLCIPLFGDQNYNSAIVNQRRAGKVLLKGELDGQKLRRALGELLAEDNEFSKNMRTISQKMARAPNQPRETILRHVEFAAEFQGHFEELDLEGARMGMFSYLGLDFLLPLAILTALGLAVLAKLCLLLIRSIPAYFHLVLAAIQISLVKEKPQ